MEQYNNNEDFEESEEQDETNDDEELEKDFFITNKKSGRFIVICGRKGSGKSWLATNFIAISYLYNLYDAYHFVLPEYFDDANEDTYKFIEGNKNTTVYDTYTSETTAKIKQESKTKKILYVLDDATSYLFENKNKPELIKLVTTSRHGKGITIIVLTHALKNVLLPAIRGMIDYLFIGSFTNANMIEKQLWEENCSIMISKEEFLKQYKENIIKDDHNFMFINGKCQFSFTVNQWNLSTFDRNKAIKHDGKVKIVSIDKHYKIKNKIKDKNEVKKLENQYLWKPEKAKNDNIQIMFKNRRKK